MITKQEIIDDFSDTIWQVIQQNNNTNANTFKKHLYQLATEHLLKLINHSIITPEKIERAMDDNHVIQWQTFSHYRTMGFYIKDSSQRYNKHKQLFKKAFHEQGKFHFNPLETSDLEQLNDGIERIIHLNDVKKFAHSFVRSYKNLLNEQSYELFSNLMESDLTREQIQQNISRIAAFQSTDDLNQSLKKILSNEHSMEHVLNTVQQAPGDAQIAYQDDDIILVQVNDFEAATHLASTQWCIGDNASVFEQYLYEAPFYADYYGVVSGEDLNEVRGVQFIAYDFTKEQDDPKHMIGFTVAANGVIVAAFDKNNDSVEKPLEQGKLINLDVITQAAALHEHTKEEIKTMLVPEFDELALQNPHYIIANTKNPLHVFVSLCNDSFKNGCYQLIEKADEFLTIKNELLHKSIEDFFQYKQISTSQMLNDLLDYHHFLQRVEQLEQSQSLVSEHEDNTFDIENELHIEIEMETKAHHIFGNRMQDSQFHKYIENQLDDSVTAQVLFMNHRDSIINTLSHDIDYCCGDIETTLTQPNSNLTSLSYSLLDHFAPYVIGQENDDVSNKVQKTLALRHCLNNPKSNQQVEIFLMKTISNGDIHFNKLLGNINQFSESISVKAAEHANQNPECFENIKNEIIQKISHNSIFVNALNQETCRSLNQSIHDNSLNFGSLKDSNDIFSITNASKDDFDFFERMAQLKDKGILDDTIVKNHYNPSEVCFGNKHKESLLIQPETRNKRIKPH